LRLGERKREVMTGSEQRRSRDVRAAINESTFREINEQLVATVALDGDDDELHDVVCECARADCTELVTVSVAEYDAARAEGERFVVAPSVEHVIAESERVVVRNDRYWMVEKIGVAGDVANDLDPRDDG
jgi:hypothetical protein